VRRDEPAGLHRCQGPGGLPPRDRPRSPLEAVGTGGCASTRACPVPRVGGRSCRRRPGCPGGSDRFFEV